MTTTDNFNLNIADGTDKYNHLTVDNPNYETIDTVMKSNEDSGVQTATELFTQNVHAITRNKPDAGAFRFTAVSRFTAGDTFTIDGVQVTALTTSGEALPDGAFIIGSEVFAILKGSLLTVFVSTSSTTFARDSEKLNGQTADYYATSSSLNQLSEVASAAGNLASQNTNSINILTDEVNNLKRSGYGEAVDITTYSGSSNKYTIPEDGIIDGFVSGAANSTCAVWLYRADDSYIFTAQTSNPVSGQSIGASHVTVPVFKGMRVYVTGQGTHTARFVPYVR